MDQPVDASGLAAFIRHFPNVVSLYLTFVGSCATSELREALRSLRKLESLELTWFDDLDASWGILTEWTPTLSRFRHFDPLPIEIGIPFVANLASSLKKLEINFEEPDSPTSPLILPIHLPLLARCSTNVDQLPLASHWLRLRESTISYLKLFSTNTPVDDWLPLLSLVRELRGTLKTLHHVEVGLEVEEWD